MTESPIFILGSGRCGSTLLQRILNSYSDITIWGEHHGFLRDLAAGYFKLVDQPPEDRPTILYTGEHPLETPEQLEQLKAPEAWQGLMNGFTVAEVTDHFRWLLCNVFRHRAMADGSVWGFKEIRYGRDDRVLEFLQRLFPDARFIFVVRDGLNTVASKAERFYSPHHQRHGLAMNRRIASAAIAWREQYRQLYQLHNSGTINSHWVQYERLTADIGHLAPLMQQLGKTIDDEQRRVLAMPEGRGAMKDESAINERYRYLNPLQLAVTQWLLGEMNEALGYDTPASLRWLTSSRRMVDGRMT